MRVLLTGARSLWSRLRSRPMKAHAAPGPVFVVGATGTGKSRLAVDIAESLSGEVINADSLQVCAAELLLLVPFVTWSRHGSCTEAWTS